MPNLPKGPNSTFLNTYKVGTNPFEFYRECHREYGDPFTVPAMNGTVVCTGSPEGARQIFTTPTDHFLPFGAEALEPIAKHSIFLLSGSRHKEERKLLAPSFHGARMKLYAQDMSNAALSSVEGLEAGASFNVIDNFLKTAMEIILRTIFGVEEKSDIERLSEEVKLFSDAVSPSFIFFKMLQHEFGGIGPWSRFKAAEAKFNAIIYEIIAERRTTSNRGVDVLSLLLDATYEDGTGMDDDQIRDELVTLLIAGHETTSVMMTWLMYHLYSSSEALVRVIEEVKGADLSDPTALSQLPYFSAACKEALRLHPVISDHLRQLQKPINLLGHDIPAGTAVAVLPSIIHSNETIYPDPGAYRPERFLERNFSSYEFLPFGGAPRRCIGSAFALFQIKVVVGTMLSAGRFERVDGLPLEPSRRGLVIGPRADFEMRYIGKR